MKILSNILDLIFGALIIAVAVILLIPVEIYWGYVLAQLWNWFLVPLGVHVIGVAEAMGISTVFAVLTLSLTSDLEHIKEKLRNDEDEDGGEFIMRLLKRLYVTLPAGLTLLWGFGAVVHHFL
jgi:hypothetical protein